MALIACKECGKEISSKASKCPNCGVRLKMHIILKIIIFFMVLPVFLGILSAVFIPKLAATRSDHNPVEMQTNK